MEQSLALLSFQILSSMSYYITTHEELDEESTFMADFLHYILEKHVNTNCSLVLVHNYSVLPEPYWQLLRRHQLQWRPTLNVPSVGTSRGNRTSCQLLAVLECEAILWTYKSDYVVLLVKDNDTVASKLNGIDANKKIAMVRDGIKLVVHGSRTIIADSQSPVLAQFIHGTLHPPDVDIFRQFSVNLMGKPLRMACRQAPPLITLKEVGNRTVPDGGRVPPLLTALERALNFTLDAYETPDQAFGVLHNGVWNGIIGHVKYGHADAGSELAIAIDRWGAVDFATQFSFSFITFLVSPSIPVYSLSAIVGPFHPFLWLATASALGLAGMLLSLMDHKTIVGSILGLTRPILEQGCIRSRQRSFVASWLLFSILIATAYKSKLMAVLTSPQEAHYPKTFEELAETSMEIAIGHQNGITENLMLTSETNAFVTLRTRLDTGPTSFHSCAQRVLTGRFACVDYNFFLDDVVDSEFRHRWGESPFVMAPAATQPTYGSLFFGRGSPLVLHVNRVINNLVETGLVQLWTLNHLEKRRAEGRKRVRSDVTYSADDPYPLSTQHLSSAYLFIVVGFTVALCVLIFELFFWRKNSA